MDDNERDEQAWYESTWYVAPASRPPYVAHRLTPDDRHLKTRTSRCGSERRQVWEPVEEFPRPEAFQRCEDCAMTGTTGGEVDARSEPLLHSNITDALPDNHPLAFTTVNCAGCGTMVHALNNESMQTWVEAGNGNWCLDCVVRTTDGVLEDEWGL